MPVSSHQRPQKLTIPKIERLSWLWLCHPSNLPNVAILSPPQSRLPSIRTDLSEQVSRSTSLVNTFDQRHSVLSNSPEWQLLQRKEKVSLWSTFSPTCHSVGSEWPGLIRYRRQVVASAIGWTLPLDPVRRQALLWMHDKSVWKLNSCACANLLPRSGCLSQDASKAAEI